MKKQMAKGRPGRPPHAEKLVRVNFKFPEGFFLTLRKQAKENGRTLTGEVLYCLAKQVLSKD